jgi:hypothetical protein
VDGQSVWFAALLLYVYDSTLTTTPEAILRYSLEGVSAQLVTPSLTIGSKRIYVPNPLRPDYCDLPLDPARSTELSSLDRYFIERGSWAYFMHQFVAAGALLILFVLTPILATRMNFLHATLIGVGMTYWLSAFHWLEMWKNRRVLGIDGKAIRKDMLHVLLCPPNAVNCARRIAALRHPRFGVLPTLRVFARYDAEKYQEQFQTLRAAT